jgi:diaminopimelate decarboxylase
VILEPGRHIVAPAGALLSRVVDVKERSGGVWFVVLDAGMTELIRPMLYNAFHRIEPLVERSGPQVTCDIVGPLCESSDTLGKERSMPRPEVGDLLAVLDTGAYGSVMASNYNRRPMPAEVLVDQGRYSVIRRRQTVDDLVALES